MSRFRVASCITAVIAAQLTLACADTSEFMTEVAAKGKRQISSCRGI